MCQEGVTAFVQDLCGRDISDLEDGDWQPVADGFGNGHGPPKLLIETCPLCNEPFPIVNLLLLWHNCYDCRSSSYKDYLSILNRSVNR